MRGPEEQSLCFPFRAFRSSESDGSSVRTQSAANRQSDAATVENLIWETQTVPKVSLSQMMDEQKLSDAKNSHI